MRFTNNFYYYCSYSKKKKVYNYTSFYYILNVTICYIIFTSFFCVSIIIHKKKRGKKTKISKDKYKWTRNLHMWNAFIMADNSVILLPSCPDDTLKRRKQCAMLRHNCPHACFTKWSGDLLDSLPGDDSWYRNVRQHTHFIISYVNSKRNYLLFNHLCSCVYNMYMRTYKLVHLFFV